MTLLGKIFVVLIFIMSLVFMSFSVMVYATHRNWKMIVTNTTPTEKDPLGLESQLEDSKNANRQQRMELEKMKNELAIERAARREALARLEARATQLNDQLVQKQAEYVALMARSGEAIETVDTTTQTAKRLKDEVAMLRSQVTQTRLDRDQQLARVVELTDGIHQMRGNLGRLKTTNGELLARVNKMKQVLDAHGLPEVLRPDIPPPLEGLVTDIARDKYIEVSIGSDDGLLVGHELNVTREGTFLGRAVVRKTNTDRSVGELMDEYRKGRVQRGDFVKTNTRGRMLTLKSR